VIDKCLGCGRVFRRDPQQVKRNRLPEPNNTVRPESLDKKALVRPAKYIDNFTTLRGKYGRAYFLGFGFVEHTHPDEQQCISIDQYSRKAILWGKSDPWGWRAFNVHRDEIRPVEILTGEASYRSQLSPGDRFDILKEYDYQCQICGRTAHEDGVKLHVDHKLPKARGGTNDPENLWVLCKDCNLGKGAKSL
jgi:hypothetical protein